MLTDLLEVTGEWVARHVASLPPDGGGPLPVDWAGEERSTNWMDVGREYTERWHHQAQIRDAVGVPRLLQPRWLDPLPGPVGAGVPAGVLGARRSSRHVGGLRGRGRDRRARGPSPGRDSGWVVLRGRAAHAAASARTDADTAWRLLYNALSPDDGAPPASRRPARGPHRAPARRTIGDGLGRRYASRARRRRSAGTSPGSGPGARRRGRPDRTTAGGGGGSTSRRRALPGSSLVASHACVRHPASRSSGAPGPPIFVGTQPGLTAFDKTLGQRRATANASSTS